MQCERRVVSKGPLAASTCCPVPAPQWPTASHGPHLFRARCSYGPKTVLVVARPAAGGGSCTEGAAGSADGSGSGEATEQQRAERRMVVQEFVLLPTGGWQLSRWGKRRLGGTAASVSWYACMRKLYASCIAGAACCSKRPRSGACSPCLPFLPQA